MGAMPTESQVATQIEIRSFRPEDWPSVRTIYEEGIATGEATFETKPLAFERWDATHPAEYRFVATRGDVVVGWIALSPVSDRCVYAGVGEISVYVAEHARGSGIGRRLTESLIARTDAGGIWTIQAGIFPENTASVQLHLRCGFRVVGTRERLGQLNGRWRDALLLERRKP
jgi:phosphinothricin acetyltransferase